MNSFFSRDCSTPRGPFPAFPKAQVTRPQSHTARLLLRAPTELRPLNTECQVDPASWPSKRIGSFFSYVEAMKWRHMQDLAGFFLSFIACCRSCYLSFSLCTSVLAFPYYYTPYIHICTLLWHEVLDKFVHLGLFKRQQNIKQRLTD